MGGEGKWRKSDRTVCMKCGCVLLPWLVEVSEGKLLLFRSCVECGHRLVEGEG